MEFDHYDLRRGYSMKPLRLTEVKTNFHVAIQIVQRFWMNTGTETVWNGEVSSFGKVNLHYRFLTTF